MEEKAKGELCRFSGSGSNGDADRCLHDEALQVHGGRVDRVAAHLPPRLRHRAAAALHGGVSVTPLFTNEASDVLCDEATQRTLPRQTFAARRKTLSLKMYGSCLPTSSHCQSLSFVLLAANRRGCGCREICTARSRRNCSRGGWA